MKHAYVTFFNKSHTRLKKVEEWLIPEKENLLLLELFNYGDFEKYKDYDHTKLRTVFVSSLSATKKALFLKILDKIADLQEKEYLEPFSSFAEIGLSFEEDFINIFYSKNNG